MNYLNLLICPACGNKLNNNLNTLVCTKCHKKYKIENGIPLLFYYSAHRVPSPSRERVRMRVDVTDIIKSFYENTPFPNYEDLDSKASLKVKAEKGVFARLLDNQIPFRAKILEVGCGTGQLSNFLGISGGRTVIGTDICLNSLKLGFNFKKKNAINNVAFVQMNLFKPVFKPESFDIIICNGVLHHTGDPYGGFQSISKLVKKGGYIIIGLYHTYGRIPTDIKRFIFNKTNDRFKFLDVRLRDKSVGDVRKNTWFLDQYKNPHESKHTIREVLKWFDHNGFKFINSIPNSKPFESFSDNDKLFGTHDCGSYLDNLVVDLGMFFNGTKEGGFFIMIGMK